MNFADLYKRHYSQRKILLYFYIYKNTYLYLDNDYLSANPKVIFTACM